MASVTYDDRSFLVDGQRIWLVSGSVQYFRLPAALWRDRLLKAKRGGLNCISTYVAWNFHEPVEGRWELSGDQDIVAFVQLAAELGLYVILRPGPYICADWDFGGLPAWLTTKTGMAYRTTNAAYTHYFDKYFRQVLPHLAELQVPRGGNIILIQNENGYYMTTMPDRLSYLEFISQLFRRAGFEIPIINCNHFSDPPLPDSIECIAGRDDLVQRLKRLRRRQPSMPLMAIEFYNGWFDTWGGEHHTMEAAETARRAMETLGCGAQLNYYMYHGGTNFAFWGSRLSDSDASYETTSYDYDAPLAEGGGLTEKYYLTRLVNLLGSHMGRYLAPCIGGAPAASVQDSTAVLNLAGPDGSWAFLTNNGRSDISAVRISLPSGKDVTVPLGRIGAAAVPFDLTLVPETKLDYTNLTPLGFFGDRTLVLHGPAGWQAEISVNGCALSAAVPKGDDPAILEHQGLQVVLVHSDLAARTWLVEDTLVFGPSFVGETLEDIQFARGARQCALLPLEGSLGHRKAPGEKPARPAPPRLKPWKRVSVCTEPVSSDLPWRRIDRPLDTDRLGVHRGYVWYRLAWSEPRPRKRSLFFPGCEDRATVYLNGSFVGIWGRSEGAERRPISADVRRGENALVLLVDNLGRANFGWRLGEAKGLFDHVYEAKLMRIRKPKLKRVEKFPRRILPRALSHLIPALEKLPLWSLEVDLGLSEVCPVHLAFTDVPFHVAALCNDRTVAFLPCHGRNYGDLTLAAGLQKGRNLLQLLMWGEVEAGVADRLRFYSLVAAVSQGATWSYRPWEMPTPGGPVVGKDQPAWYASSFKYQPTGQPLFAHIAGARKGQVFLNGHNAGRFWTIGPQEYYYLPDCWLQEDNELLLFVEQGDLPRRTRLEFRPLGPYRP
jgi:hypothetical protein